MNMVKYTAFFGVLLSFLSFNGLTQEDEKLVLIKTSMGNMKVKLYNETPKHRDNFLKLVEEGFYEGCLFHRVIDQFMIQAGDPDSKNAEPGQKLGDGGPGYTIPAEFYDSLIHKKGALAAARMGDEVNPEKESSGSQFYIVHGKQFRKEDVENLVSQKNLRLKQQLFTAFFSDPENSDYMARLQRLKKQKDQQGVQDLVNEVTPMVNATYDTIAKYSYTEEQVQTYVERGGAPHLDGDYTVFGEVVEGMDVVDKIAGTATGAQNRPKENVVIEKMKVVKR